MPDQLGPLFLPPPPGPAQPMSYLQGVVLSWDPATLEGTVQVGTAVLENLPVLGVAEAASFEVGTVVGIMVAGPTMAIIGRFVTPGTADATDAITQVGRNAHVAAVNIFETTTTGTWTDLTTPGPAVTDVLIGASGKALVTVSAYVGLTNVTGVPATAQAGYAISGATTVAPDISRAVQAESDSAIGGPSYVEFAIAASFTSVVDGLNPGLHTFTMKYQANGNEGAFDTRSISVTAL